MNYKMIRDIIGMILMAESAFMVLPMLVSVFYKEYDVLMPFVYSILAAFATSLVFGLKKPKNDRILADFQNRPLRPPWERPALLT